MCARPRRCEDVMTSHPSSHTPHGCDSRVPTRRCVPRARIRPNPARARRHTRAIAETMSAACFTSLAVRKAAAVSGTNVAPSKGAAKAAPRSLVVRRDVERSRGREPWTRERRGWMRSRARGRARSRGTRVWAWDGCDGICFVACAGVDACAWARARVGASEASGHRTVGSEDNATRSWNGCVGGVARASVRWRR